MRHAIDEHLNLTEVEPSEPHIAALFELLRKRQADHRISHGTLPSFEDHREFVRTHPYRHWFLVSLDNAFIGTLYLTNENVLGVFIEEAHRTVLAQVIDFAIRTFDPLPAVPSLRNAAFIINLAPGNTAYAEIVEQMGGRLVQNSYVLPNPAATTAYKVE